MKKLFRLTAAFVLTACLPALAHAQVPSGITQPPRGAPITGGAQETADEPWNFSIGVGGSYEGNLLFNLPEGEETDFSHAFNTSLSRTWKLRRGGAAMGASASQSFYRDTVSLNDFRYDLFGSINHMITRRLTWSGGAATSSGLARDSRVLTDSGLVLPSEEVRSSSSSSTFSYQLTPKSHLGWSVSQSGVGFSSALFAGGTTLASNVSYSRSVGKAQSVGVMTDYSRTFGEGENSNVYGVLGTWSMGAGRGWTAYASGGVRPYSVPDEGYRLSLALAGGVTRPVRPGQIVGITYSRSVEQGFGFSGTSANNLVQNLSGVYSLTLSRKLSASFSGTVTFAQDPVDTDRTITGQVGQASFSYRILRNLSVSGGTSLYSRVENDERVNSSSVYFNLNYVTTWR